MLDAFRGFLLRLGRWPRLLAAAACLLLALLSTLESRAARAHAHTPDTVPVIVAARAVPAGAALRDQDVRQVAWPRRLRPDHAVTRVRDVEGRRVGAALARGEPLTSARLVGSGLTAGLPPGTGAIPVPVTAATLTLVHPGDRVDVYAGSGELTSDPRSTARAAGQLLAPDVLVVATIRGTADDAPALVLAADRVTAVKLAESNTTSVFSVVARNP